MLIPLSEAERMAAAVTCPVELLVYPEGNHSCNNIPYKVQPAVVDWLMERLRGRPDLSGFKNLTGLTGEAA
jgi:hypothetical protein